MRLFVKTMGRSFAATRITLVAGVLAISSTATTTLAVDKHFKNTTGNGLWTAPTNWEFDSLPVAGDTVEMFLKDSNNNGLPLPIVEDIPTITLNSGDQTFDRFKLGVGSDSDLGNIQLLMTGGSLNFSLDSILGNGGIDPNTVNTQVLFNQIGGAVNVTGGTGVDIKLGGENKAYVPASTYSISGGSLNSTGTISFARQNAPPGGPLKFEIVGTGPTSIEIEEIKTETNTSARQQILGFVLDAGGVTPLVARDEIQMLNLSLELSLSAVPPSSEIVLIQADRLSDDEQFNGLANGSTVSAPFGNNLYTWNINYFDNGLTGFPENAVVLNNLSITPLEGLPGDFDGDGDVDGRDLLNWQRNPSVGSLNDWQTNYGTSEQLVSVNAVPEPTSVILIGAAAMCLFGLRRT
jgi:hypothetical protein